MFDPWLQQDSIVLKGMSRLLRAMCEVAPENQRDDILKSIQLLGNKSNGEVDGREWWYSFQPPGKVDSLRGQISILKQVSRIRDMTREW